VPTRVLDEEDREEDEEHSESGPGGRELADSIGSLVRSEELPAKPLAPSSQKEEQTDHNDQRERLERLSVFAANPRRSGVAGAEEYECSQEKQFRFRLFRHLVPFPEQLLHGRLEVALFAEAADKSDQDEQAHVQPDHPRIRFDTVTARELNQIDREGHQKQATSSPGSSKYPDGIGALVTAEELIAQPLAASGKEKYEGDHNDEGEPYDSSSMLAT
jgi:hypothetical protein